MGWWFGWSLTCWQGLGLPGRLVDWLAGWLWCVDKNLPSVATQFAPQAKPHPIWKSPLVGLVSHRSSTQVLNSLFGGACFLPAWFYFWIFFFQSPVDGKSNSPPGCSVTWRPSRLAKLHLLAANFPFYCDATGFKMLLKRFDILYALLEEHFLLRRKTFDLSL